MILPSVPLSCSQSGTASYKVVGGVWSGWLRWWCDTADPYHWSTDPSTHRRRLDNTKRWTHRHKKWVSSADCSCPGCLSYVYLYDRTCVAMLDLWVCKHISVSTGWLIFFLPLLFVSAVSGRQRRRCMKFSTERRKKAPIRSSHCRLKAHTHTQAHTREFSETHTYVGFLCRVCVCV